jgi:hypothetical protein
MSQPATDKQIAYIHALLRQVRGRDERYLGSWAKEYGLTSREHQGEIDRMDRTTASKLIDGLLAAK